MYTKTQSNKTRFRYVQISKFKRKCFCISFVQSCLPQTVCINIKEVLEGITYVLKKIISFTAK